ncbi:hypothetical protein HMPREF9120_02085 [Neisseria sp. oral taxon 020 str. F0370]|nr:hypothetical protein HMPREF9120_02085 [Neisseria sp. oral taxon 020 str. F0370]
MPLFELRHGGTQAAFGAVYRVGGQGDAAQKGALPPAAQVFRNGTGVHIGRRKKERGGLYGFCGQKAV